MSVSATEQSADTSGASGIRNELPCSVELLVPGPKCGVVIGKDGATIIGLQRQYGVKMLIEQESAAASAAPKKLRITGPAENVEEAKRRVEFLIGFERVKIGVPRDVVGFVIGTRHETQMWLQRQSGANITFKDNEDPTSPDRCCEIKGLPEQIERATQLIAEIVQPGP